MDWNKVGAVGSLGSFLLSGLIFAVQVWPLPQLKAKAGLPSAQTNEGIKASLGTKWLGILLMIGYVFAGISIWGAWHQQAEAVTPENIESNIRAWADDFQLGMTKEKTPDDSYFVYLVTLQNSHKVFVGRKKDRGNYIRFEAEVPADSESVDSYGKLMPKQQTAVVRELALELAYSGVSSSIHGPAVGGGGSPLTGITVSDLMPITSDLTEATFVSYLNRMDHAIEVAQAGIPLAIDHATSH